MKVARRLTELLPSGLALALALPPASAQTLYGIDTETGVLYSISTLDASVRAIGPTGIDPGGFGASAAGLVLGPDGFLYTFDVALFPYVFRIDPATAQATPLAGGPYFGMGFLEGGLAMDAAGVCWAAQTSSSRNLFQLDLATGGGTLGPWLGPSADISGLAFRSDGALVGIDRASNALVLIDTASGGTTPIAPIAPALGFVGGMAVQGGTGYFCTGGAGTLGTGELFAIDLFTGAIGLVGALGAPVSSSGISGLAETPSATIVPYCFGTGALAPCPCGNSGFAGRGCENSAGTGGARLVGTGTTVPDTLVLTSTGELPTALTIFLQGSDTSPAAPFGDGMRCASGNLKRLYVKSASGGVASAPGAGDPPVSQQSASLGDPIPSGATRYCQAYYRDASPVFCTAPAGGTFNASQGLRIVW